MVYEIIDYFGDYLSIEELEYWIVFDVVRNAEVNGVNIKGLSLEDAVERIDQKVKERQLKWKRSK
jgi:hypothetical protein